MSTSTLDKATDKIIKQMTPEELAKYVSDMTFSQAERSSAGKITTEEADKQLDLFVRKHLVFTNPYEHIRYLQALAKETNKQMMKSLGEEHLRYLDSEIKASELVLVAYRLTNLLCDSLRSHATDTEAVDRFVKTALNGFEEATQEHLTRIDALKEAKAKFLNHRRWEELGTRPESAGRKQERGETNRQILPNCYKADT